MVWQRVAEIAATVIGIVGFGVAVVALRFALSAQHFVTPHVALGISIGSALAGIVAACVVTFFTFLPSFFFILAGGPVIESTHGQLRFTAPLTAITAAVVGVIVNLAAFFAWHVLWPHGWEDAARAGGLDPVALAIGVAAALALFRAKVGVIPVILACATAGLAVRLGYRIVEGGSDSPNVYNFSLTSLVGVGMDVQLW
jgi:chromate transport protein ChrA